MKKYQVLFILAIALVLSACSGTKEETSNQGLVNDGEPVNENGSIDHGVDEDGVGFNMLGETVEEAQNVPDAEKEQILAAFDTYIKVFNDKDIDGYIATLSEDTESFDLEEERNVIDDVFNEYDVQREASDVTIVKYSETEAQVFAKLKTSLKELSSGLTTNPKGRQVTVFTKDDSDWKVASVYFIQDQ